MVACEEGATLPSGAVATTLQACKDACDAAAGSGCHSFSFSSGLQRCVLRQASGEPHRFCSRSDWITYWRIDIPGRSPTPAAAPAPQPANAVRSGESASQGHSPDHVGAASTNAVAAGAPRRAIVQGRRLVDSASGAELQLHGLNVYLDYLRFDDMALIRQLLPSTNFVRLVGVFWHDTHDAADCSCCTDDASTGYFAAVCLEKLQQAIRTITSRGVWVVVAAKARFAAGEGWPDQTDVRA